MDSMTTGNLAVVNGDICDCDQRCSKCGKLKRQGLQQDHLPWYPVTPNPQPVYPTQPVNPFLPWITYTTTCTHQE